jgi:hypothetical protein
MISAFPGSPVAPGPPFLVATIRPGRGIVRASLHVIVP